MILLPRYLILDILGQGTFGQVVKCQNMKTHEIVAVKVVKNKPAYFNQSMMEVTILELVRSFAYSSLLPFQSHHTVTSSTRILTLVMSITSCDYGILSSTETISALFLSFCLRTSTN